MWVPESDLGLGSPFVHWLEWVERYTGPGPHPPPKWFHLLFLKVVSEMEQKLQWTEVREDPGRPKVMHSWETQRDRCHLR